MTVCPACRSPRTRPTFKGHGAFARCRACGTVFDTQPPSADEIESLYEGRAYYVKDGATAEELAGRDELWGYPDDYLADRDNIDAKFDRILEHLERYTTPGRLLDVGAGPGFLVARAQKHGWDAVGVDLNEWATQYARDELGVEVRHGRLGPDTFADDEVFDAITMMDVVEHVPDPDSLLGEAAKRVRPGGAIALLTPDAGAFVSRALGRRWPEVRRPGEHTVLFSVAGLAAALARHGFMASGWHSIGKTAPISTLVVDMSAAAPAIGARVHDAIVDRAVGRKVVELDPHTKFVLYARRMPDGARSPHRQPARVPRQPSKLAGVEEAILEELETLAGARRLCSWMTDSYRRFVPGARVLEVGAGIGTFSRGMLEAGAASMLLIEPEPSCHAELVRRLGDDPRVTTSTDHLPGAPSLQGADGTFDLVVCQNVLEHIADDEGALAEMARVLKPGGHLALLVPSRPKLFGALDDAYGHWRRYTAEDLGAIVAGAGLEVESLRPMNALGIAGWWAKKHRPGARVGSTSLSAYEALVSVWRPLEERLKPNVGLSLVCIARRP